MALKTRAFTLVELLIALGIFSVLGLGIYRVTTTFGRGARKNIQAVDRMQDGARVLTILHEELFWCSDISFPPLKVHSEKIDVKLPAGPTRYIFEKGTFVRSQNGNTTTLLKGLKNLQFYRHDTALLEIRLETLKQNLTTWNYLENLK